MDGSGLCRFDGLHFKVFSKNNGFNAEVIRSLLTDKKGRIWAGTKDEGIIIYDGITFRQVTAAQGLNCTTVLKLLEDKDGIIWAATDDAGLYKIRQFNADSFIVEGINESNGLSNNSVFDIIQDRNNRIWAATFGGINVITLSGDSLQIDQLRGGRELQSEFILSIAEDNNGTIWFGTLEDGAFAIEPPEKSSVKHKEFKLELLSRQIRPVNEVNELNIKKIWNIYITVSGELWFASVDNGIIRKHSVKSSQGSETEDIFEHYTIKEGLPGNQTLAVFEDNRKNIWIGTSGDGLCRFMGDMFAHYSEKDGLSNNKVQGIDHDNEGNFWLATSGGGLIKMSEKDGKKEFLSYTVTDGLPGNNLLFVSAGKTKLNPYIWTVVSDNGISRFDKKKFNNFNTNHGLLDNSVYSILVDENGIVWCGSKEGISRFDGVKFLNMELATMNISGKDVNAIIQDKNNNIWFGTRGGLAKYDGSGTIVTYDEVEGLYHKEVKSIVEGPDGNIWIGTNGGIYKFDIFSEEEKMIEYVAGDSILSSNSIRSMIFDNPGNLIVGTDRGFDKITFNRQGEISSVRNFNSTDGFKGTECNDNAVYKDSDGNIWFGTVRGLTRFSPALERISEEPPQINITSLKLFFKDINWKTRSDSVVPWFNLPVSLVLPHNENHLTFYVSAVSLDNPNKILYRYQLEGWEHDWSAPTTQIERDYPVLPPGKYTFKVIASGANGIWNTQPATFKFTINPPWYRTTWFYILCLALLVVIIMLYIKIRERKLIIEKNILEQKVRERTEEVVRQKEEINMQKEEIEEKNKDITDSINYAKRIQTAILPENEKVKKAFPDSFVFFQPRDIVSGDFYWFSQIHQDDKIKYLIAAADCTGHGIPGAFMSMINYSLLNQSVKEKELVEPSEILDEVRKGIISALKQTGESGGQKDGMDIALVSVAYSDDSAELHYSGANNSMYIVKQSAEPVLEEFYPDKMPCAISDKKSDFTNNKLVLNKGDLFYIFTDGYADQFGGEKGKKFKYPKFKELLFSIKHLPMEEQKIILHNTIHEWMGELNQIDDILVIGVRL